MTPTVTGSNVRSWPNSAAIDETPMSLVWRPILLGVSLTAASSLSFLGVPPRATQHDQTRPTVAFPFVDWAVDVAEGTAAMSESQVRDETRAHARHAALAAFDRVRHRLGLTDEKTAKLVDVARGSVRNWRQGNKQPYPATVRRLHEVDAILTAAESVLGPGLDAWLRAMGPSGVPRIDALAKADGGALLMQELSPILFPRKATKLLPGLHEITVDESEDAVGSPVVVRSTASSRPFQAAAVARRPRV